MFIVFEGLDFTGKSTQANLLSDYLTHRGRQNILTREPGGSPLAEKIRDLIFTTEHDERFEKTASFFLFLASRAEHIAKTIKPALEKGKIIICDRFLPSTLVYQDFFEKESVLQVHKNFLENITPDVTFIFDIKIDILLERKKNSYLRLTDNYYDEATIFELEKRRKTYCELAKTLKNCILIDANVSPEDIFSQIIEHLKM